MFWQANAADARGNVIQSTLGNGLQTIRGFDEVTGLPDYIQAGPGGSTTLQDLELAWNKVGSLTQRKDVNRSLTEDFYYDNLHRLDYSKLNSVQNLDLSYNAMGNILTKSDVSGSTWAYHATKKHAVITAGSNSYTYDDNGNQATRNGQSLTWTSYNYPSHVPNGTRYHDYFYAADRQRWKQVYYNGTSSETTLFVGGMLEKHTAGGITEYRHTIQAGGQPVALYTRPTSGSITTQYFLLDHLGSVAGITNSLGLLDVPENFAAFGERRDASDWSGPPSAADKTAIAGITQRGYTFHTNSEESSLIHMNGRITDSLTGRFLSPDPYVFQPGLTQSFNRYSYVRNNPLTYTDPSGFCADPTGISAYVCGAIIGTALNYIGSKLFGKKKRPPPPKGCFVTGGGTACYGKAVATKLYDIARDIYGLPRLGASSVWGVGDGTFGSGPCGWGPGCMSLDEVVGGVSGVSAIPQMAAVVPGTMLDLLRDIIRKNQQQHDEAVEYFIGLDTARGFEVLGREVRVKSPDGHLRIYDYVLFSPVDGHAFGIEVKSTRRDILGIKSLQAAFDVALVGTPGGFQSDLGIPIIGVGYRGAIFGPGNGIQARWASFQLRVMLEQRGMQLLSEELPGVHIPK